MSTLCKAFYNNLSTDMKLSKTQISKMVKLGGFCSRLLNPLLKIGLPLMKHVLTPLGIEHFETISFNSRTITSRHRHS